MSFNHIAELFAVIISIGCVTFAEYFWKPKVFSICLAAAFVLSVIGILLTAFIPGFSNRAIMHLPLIYLLSFQVLRSIFRKWTGSEPYITGKTSIAGEKPWEVIFAEKLSEPVGPQGGRAIKWSDFAFSFLQILIPLMIVFALSAILN